MSYYDDQKINTVERIMLAEDIILPTLPTEPLSLNYLESHKEYKLAFNEYTDYVGKFYLKIMTPLLNTSAPSSTENKAIGAKNIKGSSLTSSNYLSNNYISLVIPKYIALQFRDIIPKGTEFLVAAVGGDLDSDDLKIIGLFTTD